MKKSTKKQKTKRASLRLMSLLLVAGTLTPNVTYAEDSTSQSVEPNPTIKPTLVVTPNAEKNYMELEWKMADKSQPYTYQIQQVKDGLNVPNSIPSKDSVKVLNIYPDNSNGYGSITNNNLSEGQIDLEGKPVPDSGILKTWLLKENINDVVIETVSLSDFNANPSKYLQKADGLWNYDSVFYGMWNLDPSKLYPNDTAVEHLRTFIDDGGGFMTSHHTMGYMGLDRGVNKLADEMGVEIFSNQPADWPYQQYVGQYPDGTLFPTVSFIQLDGSPRDQSTYWPRGKQVQIVKKGFLTEYPFKVGEIGQIYDIPDQHGLNVFAKGDVWMETVNPTGYANQVFNELTTSPATGESGTNNFYVHTYNNTAIINSGHSFPSITQAETRIIANTLYYLSQITTNTSWDDRSGQDLKAPDVPKVQVASYNQTTATLDFSFQSVVDRGSDYTYFVEATGRNDNLKYKSEEVTATMTSGLKGYSITVDTNPETIPDQTIETTNTNYSVTKPFNQDFYIHIGAIDNQGNMSIEHYKVDVTAPEKPVILANPSSPTNKEVKLSINYPSTAVQKKVKVGENGSWGNYTAPITVKDNTTVYAQGISGTGVESDIATFEVNNVDRNAPSIESVRQDITSPTNQDVTITVRGSDAEFGVNRVYKPDTTIRGLKGTYYKNEPGHSPSFGTKVLERIDSTINFEWGSGSPDASISSDYFGVIWEGLIYAPTTGDYTFQTVNDDGSRLFVNNKLIIDKWVGQSNVTNQGTVHLEGGKWHPIQVEHYENAGGATSKLSWKHGNMSAFEIVPTNNLTPFGEYATGNSVNKTVTNNGKNIFVVEDHAGNRTVTEATVSNIDKIAPNKATISPSTTSSTNQPVSLTVTFPNDVVKKEVKVNNEPWKVYTSPIVLNDNGSIQVRGWDEAGNVSEITQFNVTNIDKTAPAKATFTASQTSITNQAVDVTVHYPIDAHVKEYRIDNGTWNSYSTSIHIEDNARIDARSKDKAGNYSEISSYDVKNIDKVAPLKPSISADNTDVTKDDVHVSVSYPEDSFKKQVRVNNGVWKEYESPILFALNGVIEARGIDEAGNVSNVTRYEVNNIDRVAPASPVHTVQANLNTFELTGEENSNLYYRQSNGEWVQYKGKVTLNDGVYTLEFKTVDEAGNESDISSVSTVLYRDALAEAESKVSYAENNITQESVDVAYEKVDKVPRDAPEYQPLIERLRDLQDVLDTRKAIEKAIETRTDEDLQKAKEKIDLLDSSNPIIIDLIDEIEAEYKEADILTLVAKERYDILSKDYQMSKVSYEALVNIYYAIKYTGDNMYKMAKDKVNLVPTSDKYYEFTHVQLANLEEDYGLFVEERVQTDAEIKAESSVQVMEGKYDPTYAIHTQELINAVENEEVRNQLQLRLDNAKAKYEAGLLAKVEQDAIVAVEKAESTKNSYYVSEAYKKVNYLSNTELKFELTVRLQAVDAQMAYDRQVTDATRLVQFAEQYKSQYYIDLAQKKIDALPDGEDKTSLQQRLDVVKSGLPTSDQATVIKNATNYVSLAQTMKTQYYVDKAQGYVNQITDPVKKAELQAKLDAIVVK